MQICVVPAWLSEITELSTAIVPELASMPPPPWSLTAASRLAVLPEISLSVTFRVPMLNAIPPPVPSTVFELISLSLTLTVPTALIPPPVALSFPLETF